MDLTKNNKVLLSKVNNLITKSSTQNVWISSKDRKNNRYFPFTHEMPTAENKFNSTIMLVFSNGVIAVFPYKKEENFYALPLMLGGSTKINSAQYFAKGISVFHILQSNIVAILSDATFEELHKYKVLPSILVASSNFSNYKINEFGTFHFDFYSIIK